MPEDIEKEIKRYYREAQNGYIDHNLDELFFPVDKRSVFWEMAEESSAPEPWEISETNECIQLEIWHLNKKKSLTKNR